MPKGIKASLRTERRENGPQRFKIKVQKMGLGIKRDSVFHKNPFCFLFILRQLDVEEIFTAEVFTFEFYSARIFFSSS